MKVLIVRLSAIGDVVQGIPCLVALKESFPDWEISWLVEETSADLLRDHPCLSKLFVLRRNWRKRRRIPFPSDAAEGFSDIWNMVRSLRKEQFDIAIDLQGLFKSGLWTWLSGARRRVGHRGTRELAHYFLNEFVGDRPTFDPAYPLVQRYLEPARYLGADISKGRYLLPPSSKEVVAHVDSLLGSDSDTTPLIALCPWSLWPSKNWPMERWKELAFALCQDFRVVLIGSKSDVPASQAFEGSSRTLNLVGKTPLPCLPEIFRRCRVVVGPDTGPLHIANATQGPFLVMIFGSTSWRRSGPFGEGHRAISLHLPCQPCFEHTCPLHHLHCLHQIETLEVLKTVRTLALESP